MRNAPGLRRAGTMLFSLGLVSLFIFAFLLLSGMGVFGLSSNAYAASNQQATTTTGVTTGTTMVTTSGATTTTGVTAVATTSATTGVMSTSSSSAALAPAAATTSAVSATGLPQTGGVPIDPAFLGGLGLFLSAAGLSIRRFIR